jgi:hypothetical protein
MPNFADRGCHVVSVTDSYGRILGFLGKENSLHCSQKPGAERLPEETEFWPRFHNLFLKVHMHSAFAGPRCANIMKAI